MSINRLTRYFRLVWLLVFATTIIPTHSSAAAALPYIEITRPDRGRVFAIAWSPDAKYVAVGTDQGLWVYTDSLTDVWRVVGESVHALAWSPNGHTLAVGLLGQHSATSTPANSDGDGPPTRAIRGGGLQLWTTQITGQHFELDTRQTLLQDESVYALRFSPDSSRLASLSETSLIEYGDGDVGQDTLRIYDTVSGKVQRAFPQLPTTMIQNDVTAQGTNGLAWTSDGRYLTAIHPAGQDSQAGLMIWDSRQNAVIAQAGTLCNAPDVGELAAVEWSSTGVLACSGIWVAPTTDGGLGVCAQPDISGDQCQLLAPPVDGDDGFKDDIVTLAWRPGTTQLAYAEGTGIRLWDEATDKLVASLDAARNSVTMLAWSFDGAKLLTSDSDYAVRIWTRFDNFTLPDPAPIRQTALPALQWDAVVSPDGRWIANIDRASDNVDVIDTSDGKVQTSFQAQAPVDDSTVQWSPDSNMLSIPEADLQGCGAPYAQAIQIWVAHTGQLVLDLPDATSLAWLPDSQTVAVGIFSGDSLVFEGRDIHTGKVLWQLPPSDHWQDKSSFAVEKGHHSYTAALASPDGHLLVIDDYVNCGDYDNTSVFLWDIRTGTLAAHLDTTRSDFGGSGGITDAAGWSSDGRTLPVLGWDHFYLYHLQQSSTATTPELVWTSPDTSLNIDGGTPFSPDSRYFVYGDAIWDAANGWPVFRFHVSPDYYLYRWQGDSLIRIKIDVSDQTKNMPGEVAVFRDADVLPRTCQPSNDAQLSCVVGGVP